MSAASGAPHHVRLVRCAPSCAPRQMRLIRCAPSCAPRHVRLVRCASLGAPRHVRLVRCVSSGAPRQATENLPVMKSSCREFRLARNLSGDGESACDEGFRRESQLARKMSGDWNLPVMKAPPRFSVGEESVRRWVICL